MSTPKIDPNEKIIPYGRALANALRAFEVLESRASWVERQLIRLLRVTYRQRLRHFIDVLPSEVSEEILKVL